MSAKSKSLGDTHYGQLDKVASTTVGQASQEQLPQLVVAVGRSVGKR